MLILSTLPFFLLLKDSALLSYYVCTAESTVWQSAAVISKVSNTHESSSCVPTCRVTLNYKDQSEEQTVLNNQTQTKV